MSFYKMERGWQDSDFFGENYIFSEGDAWSWMIGEAAFEPCRVPSPSGEPIKLSRGQLYSSIRFMAEKWRWHKNKVDRFLKRLEKWDMVRIENGTGQNLITICNYSVYQDTAAKGGTEMGQETGQRRDSSGTEAGQTRRNTRRIEERDVDVTRAKNEKWGETIAEIVGWLDDPRWMGNYSRLYAWIEQGWDFHLDILPTIKQVMKNKKGPPPATLSYFEKAIANTHATRNAPIAKGVPDHEQRNNKGTGSKPRFHGPADATADGFAAALAVNEVQRQRGHQGQLEPADEGDDAAGH